MVIGTKTRTKRLVNEREKCSVKVRSLIVMTFVKEKTGLKGAEEE
jgi:hypothetical protein